MRIDYAIRSANRRQRKSAIKPTTCVDHGQRFDCTYDARYALSTAAAYIFPRLSSADTVLDQLGYVDHIAYLLGKFEVFPVFSDKMEKVRGILPAPV